MLTFKNIYTRTPAIVILIFFFFLACILIDSPRGQSSETSPLPQKEEETTPVVYQVGFESEQYEVMHGGRIDIAIQINKADLITGAFLIDLFFPGNILQYTGQYLPGDIDTTLFLVHQPNPDEPLIKIAGVIGPDKQKNTLSGTKRIVSLRFSGKKDGEGCGELHMKLTDDLRDANPVSGRVCLI